MISSVLGHFDETGTRVDKKLWCVHDVSNCEYTYFDISPKRGTAGMEQCGVFLGFKGTAMHDFWTSYWNYPDIRHAVCCAHLLRELTRIDENHPGQRWASSFIDILLEMKKVRDKAAGQGRTPLSIIIIISSIRSMMNLSNRPEGKIRFLKQQRKNVEERKRGRFVPLWNALRIIRHQSAFLSMTLCSI